MFETYQFILELETHFMHQTKNGPNIKLLNIFTLLKCFCFTPQ